MMHRFLICLAGLVCGATTVAASEWVRAGLNTNQPVWGLRAGLLFAIHPAGFRPPEPRGLIRLGFPILRGGACDLVNFIAIEPVVKGRKGFSELESSQLDRAPGKRLWAGHEEKNALDPGTLSTPTPGVEQLDVVLCVEKFENGAHVWLLASLRSNAPDELRLTVHAEPDSATMDYCILTATMGNMARTRLLWLRDETVSSLKLYPDYRGTGFAAHTFFPIERLHRMANGDVLVAVTTDEDNPAAAFPFPGTRHWYYGGSKVTQYWKKPHAALREDLRAAVNARYTYWRSSQAIPGGIAFENFELRENFYDGQEIIFGITRRTPEQLGVTTK